MSLELSAEAYKKGQSSQIRIPEKPREIKSQINKDFKKNAQATKASQNQKGSS